MDPSPNTITIPPEIQAAITAALAAQAQVYEGTIARLETEWLACLSPGHQPRLKPPPNPRRPAPNRSIGTLLNLPPAEKKIPHIRRLRPTPQTRAQKHPQYLQRKHQQKKDPMKYKLQTTPKTLEVPRSDVHILSLQFRRTTDTFCFLSHLGRLDHPHQADVGDD